MRKWVLKVAVSIASPVTEEGLVAPIIHVKAALDGTEHKSQVCGSCVKCVCSSWGI